jgi:hypothetical protein
MPSSTSSIMHTDFPKEPLRKRSYVSSTIPNAEFSRGRKASGTSGPSAAKASQATRMSVNSIAYTTNALPDIVGFGIYSAASPNFSWAA